MVTTFTASGACVQKAGKNVNSFYTGATADANWTELINQAESVINMTTKINYTDLYSTLNSDIKKILDEVCSNIAASYAIGYDMSGYTSRTEATTILDILAEGTRRGLELLKDKSYTQDFLSTA